MRALKRAICTSQEPVSLSSRRYSFIIDALSIPFDFDIFISFYVWRFYGKEPPPQSAFKATGLERRRNSYQETTRIRAAKSSFMET